MKQIFPFPLICIFVFISFALFLLLLLSLSLCLDKQPLVCLLQQSATGRTRQAHGPRNLCPPPVPCAYLKASSLFHKLSQFVQGKTVTLKSDGVCIPVKIYSGLPHNRQMFPFPFIFIFLFISFALFLSLSLSLSLCLNKQPLVCLLHHSAIARTRKAHGPCNLRPPPVPCTYLKASSLFHKLSQFVHGMFVAVTSEGVRIPIKIYLSECV